jgi:hypothetical protein
MHRSVRVGPHPSWFLNSESLKKSAITQDIGVYSFEPIGGMNCRKTM